MERYHSGQEQEKVEKGISGEMKLLLSENEIEEQLQGNTTRI